MRKPFTDFDIHDYRQEIEEAVSAIGTKIVQKYPWYEQLKSYESKFITFKDNVYKCRIDQTLSLRPRPYYDETTNYSFNFSIVMTPSTTPDEAHVIINSTIKTRIYDRLYSVNLQEKKKEEAWQAGGSTKIDYWMTAQEERFYNSLPGKWQAIIERVDIQRPGTWSDSYSVRVKPQHGESDKWIRLEAGDSSEMKELIEHYIETGETWLDF